MKRLVWVLLVLLSVAGAYAQDEVIVPENRSDYILSANLVGDLSLLSLGFEKLFFLKPAFTLSVKVALGFNFATFSGKIMFVPVRLSFGIAL